MGKKVYFLDSVKQSDDSYSPVYGTDDINAIVSNLVGAGVAPFPSGDTYDVSELNTLTSALVEEGTSFDGLKVNFADNKIHISQGIGYFDNGATIVVDSEGETLDYTVAETLYVYAEYNQTLNICGFRTSESEPSTATGVYTLMLATIAADGTVTDKRTVARSKIATMGKNIFKMLWQPSSTAIFVDTGGGEIEVLFEADIDLSQYNYLVCMWKFDDGVNDWNCVRISIDELLSAGELEVCFGKVYAQVNGGRLRVYVSFNSYGYRFYAFEGTEIFLC